MESHEKISDQAASGAERLSEEGERVEGQIRETRRDWEAKQGDAGVPGAVPGPEGDEDKPTEGQSERGEAADSAGQ